MLKPGGHGAIWKLMQDEGIFRWLAAHDRQAAIVRQIRYGAVRLLCYCCGMVLASRMTRPGRLGGSLLTCFSWTDGPSASAAFLKQPSACSLAMQGSSPAVPTIC